MNLGDQYERQYQWRHWRRADFLASLADPRHRSSCQVNCCVGIKKSGVARNVEQAR